MPARPRGGTPFGGRNRRVGAVTAGNRLRSDDQTAKGARSTCKGRHRTARSSLSAGSARRSSRRAGTGTSQALPCRLPAPDYGGCVGSGRRSGQGRVSRVDELGSEPGIRTMPRAGGDRFGEASLSAGSNWRTFGSPALAAVALVRIAQGSVTAGRVAARLFHVYLQQLCPVGSCLAPMFHVSSPLREELMLTSIDRQSSEPEESTSRVSLIRDSHPHSCRRAIIGSTALARRAGT
jgi:hypothetical protein